eukprot:2826707-Alexandrium_andersonii.AAC.1
MNKISKTSSPALRLPDHTWAVTPRDKANAFADCFVGKWSLPGIFQNEYSAHPPRVAGDGGFVVVRSRHAAAVLRALRVDSATGPDGLPSRILHMRSVEIALPFAKLAH